MPSEEENEVSDGEWEWEYHDTETEDFYVPIVLPTALTSTSGKNTGRKTRSKYQSIKRDENRQQQQQQNLSSTEPNSTDKNQNPTVEITKLNTFKPEVTYKGYTYTCDWATTIGTDMFFAKPDSSEARTKIAQQQQHSTTAPAKAAQLSTNDSKEASSSLVGTSRVKLVAKQVRKVAVAPRSTSQSKPDDQDRSKIIAQPSFSDATEIAGNGANKSQRPDPNPQTQPSPAAPAPAPAPSAAKSAVTSSLSSTLKRRQQQESFLRRLVEIKRQRGDADADAVPIYGVGWDSLKMTAEPVETAAANRVAAQDMDNQNSGHTDDNSGDDERTTHREPGDSRGETMDMAD